MTYSKRTAGPRDPKRVGRAESMKPRDYAWLLRVTWKFVPQNSLIVQLNTKNTVPASCATKKLIRVCLKRLPRIDKSLNMMSIRFLSRIKQQERIKMCLRFSFWGSSGMVLFWALQFPLLSMTFSMTLGLAVGTFTFLVLGYFLTY